MSSVDRNTFKSNCNLLLGTTGATKGKRTIRRTAAVSMEMPIASSSFPLVPQRQHHLGHYWTGTRLQYWQHTSFKSCNPVEFCRLSCPLGSFKRRMPMEHRHPIYEYVFCVCICTVAGGMEIQGFRVGYNRVFSYIYPLALFPPFIRTRSSSQW